MVLKPEKALYEDRFNKLDNYQNLMGLIMNSNILDSFISIITLFFLYNLDDEESKTLVHYLAETNERIVNTYNLKESKCGKVSYQ